MEYDEDGRPRQSAKEAADSLDCKRDQNGYYEDKRNHELLVEQVNRDNAMRGWQ